MGCELELNYKAVDKRSYRVNFRYGESLHVCACMRVCMSVYECVCVCVRVCICV
jgi:hypothetical protein